MISSDLIKIGIAAAAGAFLYHHIQKRRGVLKTHKQVEEMKDDYRLTLHGWIEKLTGGEVDETEIEDRVYTIIPK